MSTEQRTLHLPPGYVAEERAYGTVILDRAIGDWALVAGPTRDSSVEDIERVAWEAWLKQRLLESVLSPQFRPDAIDHIAACRVSVEFMAGEASGMSDRTAKIAGDAIDLFREDVHRHGFDEVEARRRAIEDIRRGCGDEGLEPVIRRDGGTA